MNLKNSNQWLLVHMIKILLETEGVVKDGKLIVELASAVEAKNMKDKEGRRKEACVWTNLG